MLKRKSILFILTAACCYGQGSLRSLIDNNSTPAVQSTAPSTSTSKIEQSVREKAVSGGMLKVFVTLSEQARPDRISAIRQAYRSQIQAFDEESRSFRGDAPGTRANRLRAAAKRDQVIALQRREIARYARETFTGQQSLIESWIGSLGGHVLEKFTAANMMFVEIPADALSGLEAFSEVTGVFESRRKQLDLILTTKVLGAPVLWDAGFTGGTQTAAIIDSGIASTHPGFANVNLETYQQVSAAMASGCAKEKDVTNEDLYGHGTHVAGIVASQGLSELPDLLGVAHGIGRLISIKVGVLGTATGSCPDLVIEVADVLTALESAVIDGSARVLNLSMGASTKLDDALENWVIDKLSDDYDVTIVVAAGNSGLTHSAYQLGDFAMSYNAISVANLDPHNTVSRTDDTIDPSSSSGPTPLGRRKPDIAAPGTNVVSLLPGGSYGAMTGTSMAAPHITGAAALLYDLGLKGAKEVKALLLNSVDAASWSARSGWGSASLSSAYAQSKSVESSTVKGGKSKYYRVPVDGSTSMTLVWNRHVTTITPDGSHAFGDFHDLNLAAYEESTNKAVATSTSEIDNVEKVALGGSGVAILKVTDNTTENVEEPFALAFSTAGYEELIPGPLNLECSTAGDVVATVKAPVTCRLTNTSELTVFGVSLAFAGPAGFAATGPSTFERVNPGATQAFTLAVSAPSTAHGANSYTVSVTAVAYGDKLTAKSALSVNVNPVVPQDCKSVLDPASGSIELSAAAQRFVVHLRFPGYNPQQPGLCSWSAFTASTWYGLLAPLSGSGDADLTINVEAAPVVKTTKDRSGSMHITINSSGSSYLFKQLYGK
jgi:subtilisin family serine protease